MSTRPFVTLKIDEIEEKASAASLASDSRVILELLYELSLRKKKRDRHHYVVKELLSSIARLEGIRIDDNATPADILKTRNSFASTRPSLIHTSSKASSQSRGNSKRLNEAWNDFALGWENAGLNSDVFLGHEDAYQTLSLLDRSFQKELNQWLLHLSTKPTVLKDLSTIVNRGQIQPTDNIEAIRAFAYVNVALSSKQRPATATPPASLIATSPKSETIQQAKSRLQPINKTNTPIVIEGAAEEAAHQSCDPKNSEEQTRREVGLGIPKSQLEDQAFEEAWQYLKQQAAQQICHIDPDIDELHHFCSGYIKDPASQHLEDLLHHLKVSLQNISENLSQQ